MSQLQEIFADDNCDTCCTGSNNNECDNTRSKTFFRPRSIIEDVSIYFGQSNYNNYRKYLAPDEDPIGNKETGIHLYRGFFYEQSRKSDKLAKFFLPGNKNLISIQENGTGDVGSLWLSTIAPDGELYSSDLCISPKREALGSFVNYRQDFYCLDGLWIDVKFAIFEAVHKLRPREVLTGTGAMGTLPNATTALQYLDSSALKYGKLSKCDEETTNVGFDDIEVKLGYTFLGCEGLGHLDFYGSLIIPISETPTAEFMFEPMLGRAHAGLGFGFNGGYKLLEKANKSLSLMADFSYQYLFKRSEMRSLDLINNGEWSRYLRLVNINTPAVSFPAINVTTRCVDVTPRSTINFWAAAHYQACAWHAEVGYNLWWRQSEKVCLRTDNCCPLDDLSNYGIFDLANTCQPTTASTANISQSITVGGGGSNDVVSDPAIKALSLADLDLCSTANSGALTNKFYGMVSYDTCFRARPINIGVAGSIEFARNYNALDQWGVWINLNVNF